jgi:hypothetical protein
MDITPQILNEALRAFVHTFPRREALSRHISAAGLTEQADEIAAKLNAVLKTAEDYLYDYPGGVTWTETFVRNYHILILKQHSWLDAESLGRIHSFSGWLCWHEGLNAK